MVWINWTKFLFLWTTWLLSGEISSEISFKSFRKIGIPSSSTSETIFLVTCKFSNNKIQQNNNFAGLKLYLTRKKKESTGYLIQVSGSYQNSSKQTSTKRSSMTKWKLFSWCYQNKQKNWNTSGWTMPSTSVSFSRTGTTISITVLISSGRISRSGRLIWRWIPNK